MMKKILFVAAACILAAACKPTETETTTASLEVTPTSLSFAAEDTAPQTITVTAVGVEWTYSLAESGKEWVTIERLSDKELTVAVADNTKAEQRTAAVTFKAKDNNRIKDRSVTIIQQGAENPEVYALTVDTTVLTFEAEVAAGQRVKVTASGEGMPWSAAVEDVRRTSPSRRARRPPAARSYASPRSPRYCHRPSPCHTGKERFPKRDLRSITGDISKAIIRRPTTK